MELKRFKFSFYKPEDMIISALDSDDAKKAMGFRLKVMQLVVESMEEIKDG
jgi:hypothetical protein